MKNREHESKETIAIATLKVSLRPLKSWPADDRPPFSTTCALEISTKNQNCKHSLRSQLPKLGKTYFFAGEKNRHRTRAHTCQISKMSGCLLKICLGARRPRKTFAKKDCLKPSTMQTHYPLLMVPALPTASSTVSTRSLHPRQTAQCKAFWEIPALHPAFLHLQIFNQDVHPINIHDKNIRATVLMH